MKASRHGPELSYLFFADDLLLFSEANAGQVECIKEGLNFFCECLDQRVIFTKSSMFCSANVLEQVAVALTLNRASL